MNSPLVRDTWNNRAQKITPVIRCYSLQNVVPSYRKWHGVGRAANGDHVFMYLSCGNLCSYPVMFIDRCPSLLARMQNILGEDIKRA